MTLDNNSELYNYYNEHADTAFCTLPMKLIMYKMYSTKQSLSSYLFQELKIST